jgi:WD40 repeat protein
VRSAALSPDGKTAFTCEFAGRRSSFDVPAAQARLWNSDNGTLELDLLKVWTPKVKDKDRQDSYGYGQKWGKVLKRGLVCAAFSPDGKLLAVGQGGETDTGKIHLVDIASGKILRTVSGHRYGACDVKFSADGQYVLSSGRDTTVRICQVSDGKEVAALGKTRGGQFKDWMHAIDISRDQKTVAAADIAGFVHVWQLQS